ncbi:MAG: ribosome silencing factor [Desulfovibrio sp.]|nr:ribosome silencing factor [Desulfovibrio sp.]MBR4747772.1 ribosome silencing factor [Desulfovibrio sp.]MCR5168877.1 ribosome silencing factor [Desulfovibrio sp.]
METDLTPKKKIYSDLPALEKASDMSAWLKDHKAQAVEVIDLAGRGAFTETLVVATASSARHAQSLADGVMALCHEKRYEYLRVDGYTNGQWVLVDCNDVVVNIFQKETRELYRLESLWKVPASKEELQAMASAADAKEGKQQ